MNKYLEYLKLIPKGIPNIIPIIKGVINNHDLNALSKGAKTEIIKRRMICITCPFNSENAKVSEEYKILTGTNYKSNRKDVHCSLCGCLIDIKTASLNVNCGIEDWNEAHKEHSLPLKWTAYNNK